MGPEKVMWCFSYMLACMVWILQAYVMCPPPPPLDRIPGTDQASGEDAMGRSCILDSHPCRGMPAAVRMPACHSRRFEGERPIGAATD